MEFVSGVPLGVARFVVDAAADGPPCRRNSPRPIVPKRPTPSTSRPAASAPLLFGGLAHHRRHGPRMLDTLLIAGRETCREFTLGIALDQEHPFVAAADLIAPAFVVPVDSGPPRTGPTSWLFRTDHKSVAVTAVSYLDATDEGRGWGLSFDMIETTGRPARVRLRTFRNPTWARQVDFHGEVLVDLPIDGDAVLVDFTPYEVARRGDARLSDGKPNCQRGRVPLVLKIIVDFGGIVLQFRRIFREFSPQSMPRYPLGHAG